MSRARVLRFLLHYLRQVWIPFTISLVLLLLVASLTAAKAWIIQPVVDIFLAGDSSQKDLLILCLVVAGIFLAQAGLNWLYAVIARVASANMVRSIRTDLFEHLTRLNLGYFVARPSADLASRVVNDVGAFENAAVRSIQIFLRETATVGMLMAVLLLKEWRLALVCSFIILIAGWILRIMSDRISVLARSVQDQVAGLNRQLLEMVGGIEVILGFGLKGSWNRRFSTLASDHLRTQLRATRTSSSSVLLVLVLVGLAVSAILFVTGRALLRGDITPGDFGTFLAAMYLMQAPALNISSSFATLSRGLAAAGRAFEILEDEPEIEDPVKPTPLPAGVLDVAFDNVSFHYRDETPVLRDLSFNVDPGDVVVMVGDSGSGKSTVARLLMRFYDPDVGEVRLGNTSLRQIAREDLYRHISYVSQDVFLFDGSLKFNLTVGNPTASRTDVEEALDLACCGDFVEGLPEGLDSVVGERGVRLSGGQRQRIAIARALLSNAGILLLDEATSALDTDLELKILSNLVNAHRMRTIFAISHRLTLAEVADRVLVLKDGQLVEEGSPELLASSNGEFSRLQTAAKSKLIRRPEAKRLAGPDRGKELQGGS